MEKQSEPSSPEADQRSCGAFEIAFGFGYFNLALNSKCKPYAFGFGRTRKNSSHFNNELSDSFLLLHQTSVFFAILRLRWPGRSCYLWQERHRLERFWFCEMSCSWPPGKWWKMMEINLCLTIFKEMWLRHVGGEIWFWKIGNLEWLSFMRYIVLVIHHVSGSIIRIFHYFPS